MSEAAGGMIGNEDLTAIATSVRRAIVRAARESGGGHLGGDLSATDVLVALYFAVMRIRPEEPAWPQRDRFVLSKGHAALALYATLAHRGYFPVAELATFCCVDSRLQGHPDMTRLPGLDMSAGSLGVGVSAAVGLALGARLRHSDARVYTLLGDGECQEGSVWEAAFVAARYELGNLTAIVDVNGLQQYGWPGKPPRERAEPVELSALASRWSAFGWSVLEADGHDFGQLQAAFAHAQETASRPSVLLARTVKGRGVPFMEGQWEWHGKTPTSEEARLALSLLGEEERK